MSDRPVMIVLAPGVTHLADYPLATAWCGADVRGVAAITLEPGAEVGEHKDDCPECVRAWRRRTK